jgi:hypothetical protein
MPLVPKLDPRNESGEVRNGQVDDELQLIFEPKRHTKLDPAEHEAGEQLSNSLV